MSRLVVDASIAVKWVIPEPGADEALTLLKAGSLSAPDLIVAECANILWKKTQRAELTADEAMIAAQLIERADLEILPTRNLLSAAAELALSLNHPAYDCIYLALARERGWRFVTADDRFVRKLRERAPERVGQIALPLADAAAAIR